MASTGSEITNKLLFKSKTPTLFEGLPCKSNIFGPKPVSLFKKSFDAEANKEGICGPGTQDENLPSGVDEDISGPSRNDMENASPMVFEVYKVKSGSFALQLDWDDLKEIQNHLSPSKEKEKKDLGTEKEEEEAACLEPVRTDNKRADICFPSERALNAKRTRDVCESENPEATSEKIRKIRSSSPSLPQGVGNSCLSDGVFNIFPGSNPPPFPPACFVKDGWSSNSKCGFKVQLL